MSVRDPNVAKSSGFDPNLLRPFVLEFPIPFDLPLPIGTPSDEYNIAFNSLRSHVTELSGNHLDDQPKLAARLAKGLLIGTFGYMSTPWSSGYLYKFPRDDSAERRIGVSILKPTEMYEMWSTKEDGIGPKLHIAMRSILENYYQYIHDNNEKLYILD